MPDITPEQEEQLLDDLAAIPWVRDLDRTSVQLLQERLECSAEDAASLLESWQSEKKIERISESGGQPAANRTLNSYGWKWVRK